jgi:hypothetical protein
MEDFLRSELRKVGIIVYLKKNLKGHNARIEFILDKPDETQNPHHFQLAFVLFGPFFFGHNSGARASRIPLPSAHGNQRKSTLHLARQFTVA